MRGIAAALVCLATGCGEKALLIEVETDQVGAPTTGVELFLVTKECPDCTDGMGLPGAMTKTPGHVFYTDDDKRVFASVEANASRARFWIEPGTGDHLLKIVAVGFDNQDQPTGLVEMPDEVTISQVAGERWNATLQPRSIVDVGNALVPIGASDGVGIWRPPATTTATAADHASCMLVKHAATQTAEFIVPPTDADCDNVIAGECDRTWYQHAVAPDPTQLCLTTSGRYSACRIGNESPCVDGLGKACAPGSYCIPDNACTQQICSKLDPSCIDNLLANIGANLPRLECTVPVFSSNVGVVPYLPCTTSATVDGTAFAGCTNAAFTPILTLMYPPAPTTMFTFMAGNSTVSVHISPTTATCTFNVDIGASLGDALAMPTFHPAVFQLTGEGGDTMVIPFVVSFHTVPVCGPNVMTTCTFAPAAMSQHVWDCGK